MPDHGSDTPKRAKRLAKWAIPAGLVALAAVVYAVFPGGDDEASAGTTFEVKRGDLEIKVLSGGTSEAIESQEIRSEIEGRDGVKILEIVDEGYMVTPEDVANDKVLVRLDSSGLEDELINQEKDYESAKATYIEMQAAYDIQLNQNKSDITAAELVVKFAKMDLEKYLGQSTVEKLLSDLGLDERAEQLANADLSIAAYQFEPAMPPKSALEEVRPDLRNRERGSQNGDGERQGRWDGQGSPGGFGGEPDSGDESSGGIPLDDELIDAIAQAAVENGMPMEPERFKQMVKARSGEGTPRLSPRMAERMKEMGVDVMQIAEDLGKTVGAPAEPEAAPSQQATMNIELDSEYLDKRAAIDFSKYANVNTLEDGEAKQTLRQLQDEALVAEENYQLAKADLEATERLVAKEFETQTELDRQRVAVQTAKIKVESAQVARELYIKYEFPKRVETLLSDYEESLAALERTRAEAAAKLLQAQARLSSSEEDYLRESQRLIEDRNQLEKTVITAERSGMVVYGTSNDRGRYRGGSDEPIQEGTTVYERQLILTIPDMSQMAVAVKIHESSIKDVEKGQKARIVIESHPEETLTGEVIKVGVLPDSSDRWLNPDIKQFNVQIRIDGSYDWLRPGMSAEVEILVDKLQDVLYVPLQAVNAYGDDRVVYVAKAGGPERRVVETGRFNSDFIEIVDGVEEGEVVLLRAPKTEAEPSATEAAPEEAEETGSEEAEPDEAAPVPGGADGMSGSDS